MAIRLLIWTCLGSIFCAGVTAGADDGFEVKAVKVVGTLRKHEPPITSGKPATFFVDAQLKGVGVVKQQVDFGEEAEIEKQAAGWVGKRVVVEGRAEYRIVEPGSRAGPSETALVVTITKLSLVVDK